MSTLTAGEQAHLEGLLDLASGFVGDSQIFGDASFGSLFSRYDVDIHADRYQKYGKSKATKLRAFWEIESDQLVGEALKDILDVFEVKTDIFPNPETLAACHRTIARLLGTPPKRTGDEVNDFLREEFIFTDFCKLPIQSELIPILQSRLEEASKALSVGANLSVIFLCGSVLEGVLLGSAMSHMKDFNCASSAPKDKMGAVRKLHEWSLAHLIDTATEVGILKPDVKKFGHGLRDFRNYIHPNAQLVSGFKPDEHTAKVCIQVLKAALASVAKLRL